MSVSSRMLVVALSALSVGGLAEATSVSSVTYTGTLGSLSASAVFEASGDNLIVTLTNTTAAPVQNPGQLLTAVFFGLSPEMTLSRTSAILRAGSIIIQGSQPAGGDVGGEWAYRTGLSVSPGVGGQGLSNCGLGLFGPPDMFPPDIDLNPNTVAADGPDYGLVGTNGRDPGAHGIITTTPLIQNATVLTLSGLPADWVPADGKNINITNVFFQYGTALDEVRIPGTTPKQPEPAPEPLTLAGLALGLTGLGGYARRRFA